MTCDIQMLVIDRVPDPIHIEDAVGRIRPLVFSAPSVVGVGPGGAWGQVRDGLGADAALRCDLDVTISGDTISAAVPDQTEFVAGDAVWAEVCWRGSDGHVRALRWHLVVADVVAVEP